MRTRKRLLFATIQLHHPKHVVAQWHKYEYIEKLLQIRFECMVRLPIPRASSFRFMCRSLYVSSPVMHVPNVIRIFHIEFMGCMHFPSTPISFYLMGQGDQVSDHDILIQLNENRYYLIKFEHMCMHYLLRVFERCAELLYMYHAPMRDLILWNPQLDVSKYIFYP